MVFKYVDDNLQVNRVNMETAVYGRDMEGKFRDKHGIQCQNSFRKVVRRSEQRGMKVNASKTAMICMSDSQSYVQGQKPYFYLRWRVGGFWG